MISFVTGVLTGIEFFLMILIVFTVLYWLIPQKAQVIPFTVTVILFAIFAYMIVPDVTDDLQLYFWFIDDMREMGRSQFDYFVSQNDFDWQTYRVSGWFFYFISKLPHNHYLPGIIVFITYGLNFCVINSASKHFNIDKFHTYLGTMFFLSTYWFFDLTSGIRNAFAFGVAFAASYFFIVEKKYYVLCIIGFLIATFFHSGGIMPIIVVIITFVTLKFNSKVISVLMIFGVAVGTIALRYISAYTDSGFFQTAVEKSRKYEGRRGIGTGTNYLVNIAVILVVTLMLVYAIEYYKRSKYNVELERLNKLSSNSLFFMLGAISVGMIFVRYTRWILPVVGALTIMIGLQLQKNEIKEKGISYSHYFAPPLERFKYKIRPIVIIILIVFICVHIWYDTKGSSLIWAHFEHEWLESGREYYW